MALPVVGSGLGDEAGDWAETRACVGLPELRTVAVVLATAATSVRLAFRTFELPKLLLGCFQCGSNGGLCQRRPAPFVRVANAELRKPSCLVLVPFVPFALLVFVWLVVRYVFVLFISSVILNSSFARIGVSALPSFLIV